MKKKSGKKAEMEANAAKSEIVAEEKAVLDWIENVKFKRRRFGGVDEADVWRKIEELNRLYEKLLIADRAKYTVVIRSLQKASEDGSEANE